jgi:predicted TIM-barrel fold metal-dependent hydrolase
MRIDVHAHYWAASYVDAVAAEGRPQIRRAGQRDDLDDRLATLDACGVDVQVFSAIGLNVELPDPAASARVTRHLNDLYVDVRERYHGRFTGFGSVPLPHVDEAIVESDRALDDLGLLGIALPCIVNGKGIDHADYEPFWANLGARDSDVVVYVHPAGDDSLAHPGLGDYHLNLALGSPLQIAMAPLRIALSGLSSRYPNLKFVFALCGGILPLLWPRFERNLRRGIEQSAVAAVGPGFFDYVKLLPIDATDPMGLLRPFYWDTSVQDIPASIRLTKENCGTSRILLGSDEIFASLPEAIRSIENSTDLTEDEKHAILDENAQQLLGLAPVRAAVGASSAS